MWRAPGLQAEQALQKTKVPRRRTVRTNCVADSRGAYGALECRTPACFEVVSLACEAGSLANREPGRHHRSLRTSQRG